MGSGKPYDDDKLHFANGIADRNELDEAVMAQVRSYVEGLMLHGLFPNKVSMPLLEDEETGRQFALLILRLLAGRAGLNEQPDK